MEEYLGKLDAVNLVLEDAMSADKGRRGDAAGPDGR